MLLTLILQLFSSLAFGDVYRFPERDIHVSTSLEYQEYALNMENSVSGRTLSYMPNVAGYITPKISYKNIIGLSWAFKVPVSDEEKRLMGETKYTDVRFNFNFENFRLSTYYLQYTGMYIDQSHTIDPAYGDGLPQIQLADLYNRSFGADFTWVWDSASFSMASLLAQSERQERRGGSLLFGVSFSGTKFENPTTIIPTSIQADFDNLGLITKGQFETISFKAGYGYNLTWAQKWFAGAALQIGPGMTHRKLSFSNDTEADDWDPSLRGEFLLATGYNGDVFFSSLVLDARNDYFMLNGTDTNIGMQLLSGGLNFGVHLESIGF